MGLTIEEARARLAALETALGRPDEYGDPATRISWLLNVAELARGENDPRHERFCLTAALWIWELLEAREELAKLRQPLGPPGEAEADRPLADRLALYRSWAAEQQPGLARLLDELAAEREPARESRGDAQMLADLRAARRAYLDAGGEPAPLSSRPVAPRPAEPTLEQLLDLVLPAHIEIGTQWSVMGQTAAAIDEPPAEPEDYVATAPVRSVALRAAVLAWLRAQPASKRPCQSCQHWDLAAAEPSEGGARPCLAHPEKLLKHPAESCSVHYVPRGVTIADTEPAPGREPGSEPNSRERVVRAAMGVVDDWAPERNEATPAEEELCAAVEELRAHAELPAAVDLGKMLAVYQAAVGYIESIPFPGPGPENKLWEAVKQLRGGEGSES